MASTLLSSSALKPYVDSCESRTFKASGSATAKTSAARVRAETPLGASDASQSATREGTTSRPFTSRFHGKARARSNPPMSARR